MKKTIFIIIAALMLSCEKDDISINNETTDIAVVQSYIEPSSTVKVKLTKMLPFLEEGNTDLQTIDNAIVFINYNGNDFLLSPITDKLGEYECLDTSLQIITDKEYSLHFEYNDYTVSAKTIIPSKPINVSLNTTTYYIDTNLTGPASMTQNPMIVNWDNLDNSYHLVIVEYLETTYTPINSKLNPDSYSYFTKVSTNPINNNSVNLTTRQHLMFFGNYRIIIYKINEEYVNLYENINQSTLNLVEPLTNIENGLGIFTGMNSDTLFLEVKSL